jgi:hypothetical protein
MLGFCICSCLFQIKQCFSVMNIMYTNGMHDIYAENIVVGSTSHTVSVLFSIKFMYFMEGHFNVSVHQGIA